MTDMQMRWRPEIREEFKAWLRHHAEQSARHLMDKLTAKMVPSEARKMEERVREEIRHQQDEAIRLLQGYELANDKAVMRACFDSVVAKVRELGPPHEAVVAVEDSPVPYGAPWRVTVHLLDVPSDFDAEEVCEFECALYNSEPSLDPVTVITWDAHDSHRQIDPLAGFKPVTIPAKQREAVA